MPSGEIYATVDASVVGGGIAPMAIVSSEPAPPEGSTEITLWILWRYDDTDGSGGYTGISWYFDDENNYLKTGSGCSSEQEFKVWLTLNKPENFNDLIGDWPSDMKAAFVTKHMTDLWNAGCLNVLG